MTPTPLKGPRQQTRRAFLVSGPKVVGDQSGRWLPDKLELQAMPTIPHRKGSPPLNPSIVVLILACVAFWVFLFAWDGGTRQPSLSDCVAVAETTARLACYDGYAKRLHEPAKRF
jgi:hypothetical protein